MNTAPPLYPEKTTWPWISRITDFPERMPDGKKWPKISIITPSFNQGNFIEETIRSIVMQGYPDLEYIVMDGGSRDNTVDVLKKYDHSITKWVSEPDKGQTHAINKGIKYATGEIIAYLNSDDLYLPESLKIAALYLTSHPDVSMVYGNILQIDKKGDVIEREETDDFDYDRLLSWIIYVPQPATFIRGTIVHEIGLFDENLNLGMDQDYWVRIGLDHTIHHIREYLACARMYPEIKSKSQYLEYIHEHTYILDKLFSDETASKKILLKKSKYYSSINYFAARGHIFQWKLIKGLIYFFRSVKFNPKNTIDLFFWDLKKLGKFF
jgi:glycosyltransferase involved in cell wall biosynthesis